MSQILYTAIYPLSQGFKDEDLGNSLGLAGGPLL